MPKTLHAATASRHRWLSWARHTHLLLKLPEPRPNPYSFPYDDTYEYVAACAPNQPQTPDSPNASYRWNPPTDAICPTCQAYATREGIRA